MEKKSLIKVVGFSALIAASGAMADAGWYVGLSVGEADFDVSKSDIDDGSVITGASLDDTDTSINVYVGYQLNSYFSVEGGYIDFGEFSITGVSDGAGSFWDAGPVKYEGEADALTLGVRGSYPINDRFSVHGKLGLARWDAEASAMDGSGTYNLYDDDGTDPYYGAGASYNLGQISLNIDYIQYKDIGDETDTDVISAGISYRF